MILCKKGLNTNSPYCCINWEGGKQMCSTVRYNFKEELSNCKIDCTQFQQTKKKLGVGMRLHNAIIAYYKISFRIKRWANYYIIVGNLINVRVPIVQD